MLLPNTLGCSKTFLIESGREVSIRFRNPSAVPADCIICKTNLNIDFNNDDLS